MTYRESYRDWSERQDRDVAAWNRELHADKGPRETTPVEETKEPRRSVNDERPDLSR